MKWENIKRLLTKFGVLSGSEPKGSEAELIRKFLAKPQQNWQQLRDYFLEQERPFKIYGMIYHSQTKKVKVERDIYTYVYIGKVGEDLTGRPDAYGLLKWQAEELEYAILSCVPGMVGHVEKVNKRIAREQQNGELPQAPHR